MAEGSEKIKNKLKVLPDKPGVYQYYDKGGTIIYVGKAKNLKKRVSSYFNKKLDSGKTRILVRQIVDIKYIVVDEDSRLDRARVLGEKIWHGLAWGCVNT